MADQGVIAGRIGIAWPDKYANGDPRSTYRNTVMALRNLGGISYSYNDFCQRSIVSWDMLRAPCEISDHLVAMLRDAVIAKDNFDPKAENVGAAVLSLCMAHRFDPVIDYLDGLKWDGVGRLRVLMHKYFGADDTPLNAEIGVKMLTAAARRIYQPGCKFDSIVVLEGKQGAGKSSALRILAGSDEAFSDQDMLHLDFQGQQEALAGKWIVELAELAGLRRTDAERIKAFASRTHDRARAAYARFPTDQPRRCILVGTTNSDEYLTDPTGNRRFWPIRCGDIDLGALAADRDQLWAEAALRARDKNEGLNIAPNFWPAAAEQAAMRLETDPWEDKLADIKGEPCWDSGGDEVRIFSSVLLTEKLGIPVDRQTSAMGRRAAAAMRKLGWEGPVTVRIADKRGSGYRKRDIKS